MISLNENISKLSKKDLRRWIADREKKKNVSPDWKDVLENLRQSIDDKGTGRKSKGD